LIQKLTEVQIYEKILKSLETESIELGEKIKLLDDFSNSELISKFNNNTIQIGHCKELIRLLHARHIVHYTVYSENSGAIANLKTYFDSAYTAIAKENRAFIDSENPAQMNKFDNYNTTQGDEFCINPNNPYEDEHYVTDESGKEPYSENTDDGRNYDEC